MRYGFISATFLLMVVTAGVSLAAPAPIVTIESPTNGEIIAGGDIEISVVFSSPAAQPVTRVEVSLDGRRITERSFDTPLASGRCGFLWDTLRTEDGQHRLDVQAFAGKQFLGMATSVVRVSNTAPALDDETVAAPVSLDLRAPEVAIQSPREGATVTGKVPVIIQARDDSGKSPYVSVFVDKSLKAVTNHEPFKYTWDTARTEDGPHEIHVSAMDDSENRMTSAPVRVIVRNTRIAASAEAPVSSVLVTPNSISSILPTSAPPPTESARVSESETEQPAFSLPPPAPSVSGRAEQPVTLPLDSPEPEVAVLVSRPLEFTALPAPVSAKSEYASPQPRLVHIASAKLDEAKKPVTTLTHVPEPAVQVHEVSAGDALYSIARRYGTTVDAIAEANSIKDPNLIGIGRKLVIPGRSVMVSLRSAFDRLGGFLGWDSKDRSVWGWAPGCEVRLKIGSARARVNDLQVVMDRAAALQAGRTMVSQSFVSDALGVKVDR